MCSQLLEQETASLAERHAPNTKLVSKLVIFDIFTIGMAPNVGSSAELERRFPQVTEKPIMRPQNRDSLKSILSLLLIQ